MRPFVFFLIGKTFHKTIETNAPGFMMYMKAAKVNQGGE